MSSFEYLIEPSRSATWRKAMDMIRFVVAILLTTLMPCAAVVAQPLERPQQNQSPDLSTIRHIKVGKHLLDETPIVVGNEILAPIIGDRSSDILKEEFGAWASRTANAPENFSKNKSFQINRDLVWPMAGRFDNEPIVMDTGKETAFMGEIEIKLRAAPAIINGQIWLPVFSLAPLLNAIPVISYDGNTLTLKRATIRWTPNQQRRSQSQVEKPPSSWKQFDFNGIPFYVVPLQEEQKYE